MVFSPSACRFMCLQSLGERFISPLDRLMVTPPRLFLLVVTDERHPKQEARRGKDLVGGSIAAEASAPLEHKRQ